METDKKAHLSKIILITILVAVVAITIIIVSIFSGIGSKQNIEAIKDLTLRAEPDHSSSVIRIVPKGSSVSLYRGYKSADSLWSKIETADFGIGS